jgi:hypothetical protein
LRLCRRPLARTSQSQEAPHVGLDLGELSADPDRLEGGGPGCVEREDDQRQFAVQKHVAASLIEPRSIRGQHDVCSMLPQDAHDIRKAGMQ